MIRRSLLVLAISLGLSVAGSAVIKSNAPDYLKRAQQAMSANDMDTALKLLDSLLETDPNNPDGRLWRGRLRADRGAYDRALEDLNEAVRIVPQSAEAHATRGFVFQKKQNIDAAFADFNDALRLDPSNELALYCR